MFYIFDSFTFYSTIEIDAKEWVLFMSLDNIYSLHSHSPSISNGVYRAWKKYIIENIVCLAVVALE